MFIQSKDFFASSTKFQKVIQFKYVKSDDQKKFSLKTTTRIFFELKLWGE